MNAAGLKHVAGTILPNKLMRALNKAYGSKGSLDNGGGSPPGTAGGLPPGAGGVPWSTPSLATPGVTVDGWVYWQVIVDGVIMNSGYDYFPKPHDL